MMDSGIEVQEMKWNKDLFSGSQLSFHVSHHDYQLYLTINDIDNTKTKTMSPQTNGICERFHKTILNEFYQVTFRKKLYSTMEELQKNLDEWMKYYSRSI